MPVLSWGFLFLLSSFEVLAYQDDWQIVHNTFRIFSSGTWSELRFSFSRNQWTFRCLNQVTLYTDIVFSNMYNISVNVQLITSTAPSVNWNNLNGVVIGVYNVFKIGNSFLDLVSGTLRLWPADMWVNVRFVWSEPQHSLAKAAAVDVLFMGSESASDFTTLAKFPIQPWFVGFGVDVTSWKFNNKNTSFWLLLRQKVLIPRHHVILWKQSRSPVPQPKSEHGPCHQCIN